MSVAWSDDYTPSPAEVRAHWTGGARMRRGAEFDRMIEAVRAETLREARDNVRASSFWADGSDNYADRVRGYLSRAADRIEKEAGL